VGLSAEAQPARTSKASTAVRRGFVNLVPPDRREQVVEERGTIFFSETSQGFRLPVG
jgi:hypothetical protein